MMLTSLFSFIATLCTSVFFGAALYITLVQHPAALKAGGAVPGRFFPPMYRRAAPMQASLAVTGSVAAMAAWFTGAGYLWLIGGLVLLAVVPFTLIVIKTINDQLLEEDRDAGSSETLDLLRRWGRLHGVRSVLSGVALVLFLVVLVFE